MTTITTKHTTIHIACSAELHARLKQEAEKEGLLVTAFVRRLLLLYFKGRLVIAPDESEGANPPPRRVWHGG